MSSSQMKAKWVSDLTVELNIDVCDYLHACAVDRKQFLSTWKDLPPTNEVQSTITDCPSSADTIQQKLESNNVFMIARRSVDVGGTPQVWIL